MVLVGAKENVAEGRVLVHVAMFIHKSKYSADLLTSGVVLSYKATGN